MGKRYLLFSDTPLQVLNAAVFSLSDVPDEDNVDIVISSQFADASTLSDQLRDSQIFDNVYLFKAYDWADKFEMRSRQLLLLLGLGERCLCKVGNLAYDYFGFACPCPTAFAVLKRETKRNSDIETFLYEEGTGSYNGNIFRRIGYVDESPEGVAPTKGIVAFAKRILRLLPDRMVRYNPKAIYVKRPDLLRYRPRFTVRQLGGKLRFDAGLSKLSQCRAFSPIELPDDAIVFFEPPRTALEGGEDIRVFDQLEQSLSNDGIEFYVREHPRTIDGSNRELAGCHLANGGMWEVTCRVNNLSNCMLVGICSTAQLSPCIESGAEPQLVFLHRILYKPKDPSFSTLAAISDIAKQAYTDKTRVIEPETIDEAYRSLRDYAAARP